MIVILCSLIGQARDLIFIGRCLYNDFNKLDKIIWLTTSFKNKQPLPYLARFRLFVIGAYLSYSPTLCHPDIGCESCIFGLMYTFLYFEELPTMPPVATVGDYGALYLAGVCRE